jgi:hypothetical protein
MTSMSLFGSGVLVTLRVGRGVTEADLRGVWVAVAVKAERVSAGDELFWQATAKAMISAQITDTNKAWLCLLIVLFPRCSDDCR